MLYPIIRITVLEAQRNTHMEMYLKNINGGEKHLE
jgi:hypothetical protein